MYKWEPVIVILGRRAITDLSSGRYETLGLVTTLPYDPQQAYWSTRGLSLLIMEFGVNQQLYSWGAKKRFKFVSAPGKLKYCISPVLKAKPLLPCPIFGIQYTDSVCLPPWNYAD